MGRDNGEQSEISRVVEVLKEKLSKTTDCSQQTETEPRYSSAVEGYLQKTSYMSRDTAFLMQLREIFRP